MNISSKTQGTAVLVRRDLRLCATKEKARVYASFFKTGKGEYGEGDRFLGVTVPMQRMIAKKYHTLPLSEIAQLLQGKVHEERLTALIILVSQYKDGDLSLRKKIYDFYRAHTKYVNNWDLVDSSAQYIIGEHIFERERKILVTFARSANIWERRIAIIATLAFIRRGDFRDTFMIAELLLSDPHDLIHKAVGWMLREVGKRDETMLKEFLALHVNKMPRTTLRYAIERFSPVERRGYLRMK